MYDVGCFIKPKDGFEIIKDDVLTKYSPEVYDGCFVLYCSPSKSNLAVVMFHELGALSLNVTILSNAVRQMVVDLNDFENVTIPDSSAVWIIKDVSSFMCNSSNKNPIYSYKPCLGSMIQFLFFMRYDVEDKYNAPVFALSYDWFYIASKSSNKDELLYNVESRLRKSNPKFNVYFGERLKNFELLYKYEWVFNDRFSFSML